MLVPVGRRFRDAKENAGGANLPAYALTATGDHEDHREEKAKLFEAERKLTVELDSEVKGGGQ